jgi:hypothetical protein
MTDLCLQRRATRRPAPNEGPPARRQRIVELLAGDRDGLLRQSAGREVRSGDRLSPGHG